MSGFAVEFRRDGSEASVESANRMQAAIQLFGSDRQSANAEGPFAMAWVLSGGFTPQDRYERQPVVAEPGWRLLFLGRLCHRGELAEKLGIDRNSLGRLPDCELAMQAWRKWGRDCRAHLYGGYSIVVCDINNREIVAMRSPETSQHIFCYRDAERMILASSTKAIFAFPEIAREIDELKIADMLVLNHQDASRSFFKNVSIIPQAHTFVASRDAEPTLEYHDFLKPVGPIRYSNEGEYVERARELVDRALDNCFRTPGLPAIGLSAGLDSTTLAVAMIERMRREGISGPRTLRSYTGVPEQGWDGRVPFNRLGDESGPVRALAAMYPELDPHFVTGETEPVDRTIDLYQTYGDMPVRMVNNSSWGMEIRRLCRRDGHKVLVSGSAGNATISLAAAHILLAQWLRNGRWRQFLLEARRFTAMHPGTRLSSVIGQAVITNLPDQLYDRYMAVRGHDRSMGFAYFSAINLEFASDINIADRIKSLGWDDRYRRRPSRQQMMRVMMQMGARNDGGGMMEAAKVINGVETVSALDDRKLVEYCYAIPDDQFYRNGVDRLLVKRMMKGKLPVEVLSAPRGEQTADWHLKRSRELGRISEELDRLEDIPSIAQKIDIKRMKGVIRNWPEKTPISAAENPDYAIARYGIGRALAVARFINHVEGRN